MRLTEQELRCITLAQAIEQVDAGQTLVSAVERAAATQQAVAAARARAVQRVGVGDVLLARAQAMVQHASGRSARIAALQHPAAWARALGWGVPLAALLLGLAADRIANAHRVDLLSLPLLAVLAWNMAVYALLLWRVVWPAAAGPWLLPAINAMAAQRWGTGRKDMAARVAAQFAVLWLARSRALLAQQVAGVLHLCAAAWGAGIALSLLLRGLVVNYRFGWESTFLDAAQVHALVGVLFWPINALWGGPALSVQDIAAAQNFAGQGVAGSRWVWMYVGLLWLVVVLPRGLLAAWAAGQRRRLARQCDLDTQAPCFAALRQALPVDLVLGLVGVTAQQAAALCGASPAALHSAQGDSLRFVLPTDAGGGAPVDVVLRCTQGAALPPQWRAAVVCDAPWAVWGASWVLQEALFDHLQPCLPQHGQALQRLRQAHAQAHEERFAQALQLLAQHLRARVADPETGAATGAPSLQALWAQLHVLYGGGASPASAPEAVLQNAALPARGSDGALLAMGTSAGAAAGAAAGAKVGAIIDVGTGGMSLGAGTALGALLGGAAAWMVRGSQKKDAAQEQRWQALEAACLCYLAAAHAGRWAALDEEALVQRWRSEVTAAVAAHGPALEASARAPAAHPDALQAVLRTVLLGVMRRSLLVENNG